MTTANLLNLDPVKTYASRANAIKAVENFYGVNADSAGTADVRYVVAVTESGRFYPLFIGQSAVDAQCYFNFATAN